MGSSEHRGCCRGEAAPQGVGLEGKGTETKGEAADVRHSWTVYSRQPFPNQGEHRASLLLLCLTRLTNHPHIPKQQLPAITSRRTHVPISCTPISSSALDLGQISAPGCSRAGLLPPRSWKEHPLAAGQEGSPPLAAGGRRDSSLQHRAPWMPAAGGRSQPEGKHREW